MGIVSKSEFVTPEMVLSLCNNKQSNDEAYFFSCTFLSFPLSLFFSLCTTFFSSFSFYILFDKCNIQVCFLHKKTLIFITITFVNVYQPDVPSHVESITMERGTLSFHFIIFYLYLLFFKKKRKILICSLYLPL